VHDFPAAFEMNEDLQNEVEAINSIYGDDSLVATGEQNVFVLRLCQHDTSLRVSFPPDYPSTPPSVLGTESSGDRSRKGDAAHIVDVFRDVLGRLYQPGEVCLFDVIEEVNSSLPASEEQQVVDYADLSENERRKDTTTPTIGDTPHIEQEVPWTLSEVVVEMKSVFIARAAPVSSPDQAKRYLQHLLDNDKKVRSATHNITAWRIKGENAVTYQDCDDDGETAAGGRVLHLMQLMDIWNVMVVVTRCKLLQHYPTQSRLPLREVTRSSSTSTVLRKHGYIAIADSLIVTGYGGHQLGPKRFSIINTVARDSFVKGGFVQEDTSVTKKKGKR